MVISIILNHISQSSNLSSGTFPLDRHKKIFESLKSLSFIGFDDSTSSILRSVSHAAFCRLTKSLLCSSLQHNVLPQPLRAVDPSPAKEDICPWKWTPSIAALFCLFHHQTVWRREEVLGAFSQRKELAFGIREISPCPPWAAKHEESLMDPILCSVYKALGLFLQLSPSGPRSCAPTRPISLSAANRNGGTPVPRLNLSPPTNHHILILAYLY